MSTAIIAEAGTNATRTLPFNQDSVKSLTIDMLANEDEREVLAFLSLRPIHTIYMAGLICDNGLVSPLNRGTFYSYRNQEGKLEGVALSGQKTVIEAHSDHALEAFARLALDNSQPHLIRGEQEQIESLLDYLSQNGRTPRLVCPELLLEQRSPVEGVEDVPDLRPATLDDQDHVISINAMMAFEENGVNPLERDPIGVRKRMGRRIQQGRIWMLTESERIIFKADVISETPEVVFLEGIYVHPEKRGRGYGLRCLTQLARYLLTRSSSICLVVNQEKKRAQAFYSKAGYRLHSYYRTVYF